MSIQNIWCMRPQLIYFLISQVKEKHKYSWYIVLFGKEFWIGPNKPSFINNRDKL